MAGQPAYRKAVVHLSWPVELVGPTQLIPAEKAYGADCKVGVYQTKEWASDGEWLRRIRSNQKLYQSTLVHFDKTALLLSNVIDADHLNSCLFTNKGHFSSLLWAFGVLANCHE